MTQTGTGKPEEMIRIRPYGAGFGQYDSAYKAGKGIVFEAKFRFVFTHSFRIILLTFWNGSNQFLGIR